MEVTVMKKIISLILTLSLVLGMIAVCGFAFASFAAEDTPGSDIALDPVGGDTDTDTDDADESGSFLDTVKNALSKAADAIGDIFGAIFMNIWIFIHNLIPA